MKDNVLLMEIDKPLYETIHSVQYDRNSRFVHVKLLNNSLPFDLTNKRVILSGSKPDGEEIFNTCKIEEDLVVIEITEEMNAVPGISEYSLEIYGGDMSLLQTKNFKIKVTPSVRSKKVESRSEVKALTDALSEVQNIDNRFAETNEQLSTKAKTSDVSNLQGQIDNLVLNATGDSNAEVIQSRTDSVGITHTNLKKRLDTIENSINTSFVNYSPLSNAIKNIELYNVDKNEVYYITMAYSTHTNNSRYIRIGKSDGALLIYYNVRNGETGFPNVEEINYTNDSGVNLRAFIDWTKIPVNATNYTLEQTYIKPTNCHSYSYSKITTERVSVVSLKPLNYLVNDGVFVVPQSFIVFNGNKKIYTAQSEVRLEVSAFSTTGEQFFIGFDITKNEFVTKELVAKTEEDDLNVYTICNIVGGNITESCGIACYINGEYPHAHNNQTILTANSCWNGENTLIIGDSISDDSYGSTYTNGGYHKWQYFWQQRTGCVMDVDAIHATGFVADGTYQTDGSKNLINRIKKLDTSKNYKLIVVFLGTNDYKTGHIPFGVSGSTDYTTFIPAVEYCLKYLRENWLEAKIAVLLPLQRSNTDANNVGKTLLDYNDEIKKVAQYYSLPVLDLYSVSGFHTKIDAFREKWSLNADTGTSGQYWRDGLHPTEEFGRDYLMPTIYNFLESI